MLLTLLLIYFPALVFGFLFVKNYRKDCLLYTSRCV